MLASLLKKPIKNKPGLGGVFGGKKLQVPHEMAEHAMKSLAPAAPAATAAPKAMAGKPAPETGLAVDTLLQSSKKKILGRKLLK